MPSPSMTSSLPQVSFTATGYHKHITLVFQPHGRRRGFRAWSVQWSQGAVALSDLHPCGKLVESCVPEIEGGRLVCGEPVLGRGPSAGFQLVLGALASTVLPE